MRLNKITIDNFRCLKHYEISLAPSVTVLIGLNGSGKTALIHAIRNALSFIFTNNSRWGVSTLINGVPDLTIANIENREIWHDKTFNQADEVSIKADATFHGININWEINKGAKIGSALKTSLYKDAYITFMKEYKKSKQLPLLAFYSDSFPHVETNIGKVVQDNLKKERFAENWGFYQWNKETSCTAIWQQRFMTISMREYGLSRTIETLSGSEGLPDDNGKPIHNTDLDKLIRERQLCNDEINYITNIIKKFTDNEDISDNDSPFKVMAVSLELINNVQDISFLFSNGSKMFFSELPAGYKRLLSIVFDIAYRAYFLGHKTPNGIVIIDELDLHLHPSMEQDVLQRLRKTFPEIQFIISTHSALVISNLKQSEDTKIIMMGIENDEYVNHPIGDIYGIDYNTALSDFMRTPARNSTIDFLIESYIRLMRREKKEQALKVMNELKDMVSKNRLSIITKEIEARLNSK